VAPRLVGLVADDLTGAADAAAQFAAEGWSAHVLCSPAARPEVVDEGPSLLAVVTGVRAALHDKAAADTAAGVRGLVAQGCDRLYVKIDSTMRGSVAGQLHGALAAWGARCPEAVVVLCPAFPDEGRAVVGGEVLVDGIPVDRSPAAIDPITPVAESRLDGLVPGATAGLLPDLASAPAGNGAGSQGPRVLFVDASTDADLDAAAAGLDRLGSRGVAAGSAGLAAALARRWSARRSTRTAQIPSSSRMLIGVTSLHPRARESVERLGTAIAASGTGPRAVVDVIDTGALRTDPAAVAARFGEQVAERLAGGSYDTVVLVGGDGAAAALHRVGAHAIRVHGTLAAGVPVGTVLGGAAHGLRVVTTSGGFGRSGSLLEIVDRLQSSPSVRKEQP
jgi:D-threonate/D-erythronate kinase